MFQHAWTWGITSAPYQSLRVRVSAHSTSESPRPIAYAVRGLRSTVLAVRSYVRRARAASCEVNWRAVPRATVHGASERSPDFAAVIPAPAQTSTNSRIHSARLKCQDQTPPDILIARAGSNSLSPRSTQAHSAHRTRPAP